MKMFQPMKCWFLIGIIETYDLSVKRYGVSFFFSSKKLVYWFAKKSFKSSRIPIGAHMTNNVTIYWRNGNIILAGTQPYLFLLRGHPIHILTQKLKHTMEWHWHTHTHRRQVHCIRVHAALSFFKAVSNHWTGTVD